MFKNKKINDMDCVFCNINKEKILYETSCWLAMFDEYPVNQGHVLLIPKHHVESVFELNEEEKTTLVDSIKDIESILIRFFDIDGFNIGINQGKAAGQTINHLHIHIIPRYNGDVSNPRGGVRGVIPEKQDY